VTAPAERARIVDDTSLTGRAACRALAAATDVWLRELFEAAHDHAPHSRLALIAVGGFGRGELAPYSDLDVLLVHDGKGKAVESVASAMWYPVWDAGLKLGHAVRSVDDTLVLAGDDLDTATSLLTARPVAGDAALAAKVIDGGRAGWAKRRSKWLAELQRRVRDRQAEAGEVAYTLEPDLKDGHGGLRDVQSLWWAAEAGLVLPEDDAATLDDAYATLLEVRVALHRATRRPGDSLRLEDQDATAATAGYADADALMADVAAAARRIAWIADEAWGRVGRRTGGRATAVAPGVVLIDGEVELADGADPAADLTLVLRIAVAAARHGCRIGRRSLDVLAARVPPWPLTWPVGATDDLVALLLEGHAAIPVLEALDQRGLLARLLPEWEPVRSRPQRNAYHRFTVDRHLWEAAANASQLTDRVSRPDLLVMGALLHDLGKGYPGDHTEAGIELVRELAPRLGFGAHDEEALVAMVRHHLLLPDVALRRDLTDTATISQVADSVGSVEVLDLLHALTEADSKATGPSAWGSWKEELVADLASRVRHVLGGGDVGEVTWRLFPDASTSALMATGVTDVTVVDDRITVVGPDRPGSFSRVAGVLALHGLDVLSAQAHSEEPQPGTPPMAASQFRLALPREGIRWEPIVADLRRALDGELAIRARLADRARTYRRRRATQAHEPGPPTLVFQDGASSNATVVEVRAPNKIGTLHRITEALAEVGLDIRHATVQTIGMEVVDTFYVRTWTGAMVSDPFHRAEIERAVLHAVA
jgi:[protein-PII] uridylyltransferase